MGRRKDGKVVWRWGKRDVIYLSLHCHHQNDSCITMGSDESYFNVPLRRDKVTRSQDSVHRPQLLKRKEGEADSNRDPSAYLPDALPLGQTGSLF